MKANELRVGNYVDVSYNIERIKSIEFDEVNEDYYVFFDNLCFSEEIQILKPISLTQRLIFAAGFIIYDEDDDNNTIYAKGFYYIKKKPFSNNFFFVINKIDIKIEYLHELQNLYFALTKEELNVKL
ncbi:hypothetical protein [Tenacibaculum phage JQ]|nr:hypothetical protein [Tenacibaculum phage JQ]